MSKERRQGYFGVEEEIVRNTPGECVKSISKL